ncbi:MAG: tetratricopeptide repeat protein [Actinomycetia bacterium]|nr:tetratricopeptide repeat protein [Actinomycetes bacterium]
MTTSKGLERFVSRYSVALSGDESAHWATIDGTLCHIDISGFTSLSERLAARGRVGAEELTEVLDTVFGSMLRLVHERGGALLKFGGDALLLLFEGENHAVEAACAAVEMRKSLRSASEIPTSVGRLSLKMSIGLHTGDVHLFRASGSHTELIVAGPAASKVTEMEETAAAGEIVIGDTTKVLLPADSATQRKGNGWLLRWRTARTDAPGARERTFDVDVSALVPTALRSHLTDHKLDSEHRLATVAFIEFVGVDEYLDSNGPEETSAALGSLISAVTEIADEEEITFLGTDVDRNAGKIILVSGVPITMVDECGRVLRAARRIADVDTPFGLKIGINRGHVFSGEIGTDQRSTYTVMGDTVNLAARLMAAAPPGSIYSTMALLDESLTLFATETLEPIRVKGKAEPVTALAVLNETGSRASHTVGVLPFMGRDTEARELAATIADLDSAGATITMSGPTGIGKSRLVEEVLRDESSLILDVRSEPYGTTNPYRPFRDSIRKLLDIQRGSTEDMRDSLMSSLENGAPALIPYAPLVGDVTHIDLEPTDTTRAIDPRYRQNRVADITVELLEHFHQGPLIIVAEDTHWADAASLALVERLIRETEQHSWLVITTDRNSPEDAGESDISLEPLDTSTVESLVHAATEASPLRPDSVRAIVERAGGNPLFVQELVKAARDTGDVGSLPTSLDGVVGSQIDALEPLARQVLRYLSVLGRSFRTSVARDLIATQGVELNAATRATLSGFLDDDGADRLQFRHALVRDVAYEGLSYRRRRKLHLEAGQLVLDRSGDDEDALVDVLALHFFLGGDQPRAWGYCLRAGDNNMDAYANVEAATQFERAIETARRLDSVTDDERREVWIKLGDVRERSGQFAASLDAFTQAAKLTRDHPPAKAEVLLKRARARERSGAYSVALGETTRARRLVEGLTESRAQEILGRVLGLSALIRQAQQRPKLALDLAKQTATVADSIDDEMALATAWRVMDWSYFMLGEPEAAVHSVKAIEVYHRLGALQEEAGVANNLGGFSYFKGDWEQALAYYSRGQEAAKKVGNMVDAASTGANIAEVLLNQGRYDEAEGPLLEARRVYLASGFFEGVAFTELLLGRMYGIQGDHETAEATLKTSIQHLEDLGVAGWSFEASLHLADATCRSGYPDDALAILAAAEAEAPPEYVEYYGPLLARIRGSILDSAGQPQESAGTLEAGIQLAEERNDAYEHGLLILTLARVAHDRTLAEERQAARDALRTLGVRSVPGVSLRA